MLTKRIIPCLDIKDGRTVKGTRFLELKDAGDPVELAIRYCNEGADELVFLDISATNEKRKTLASLVDKIASTINIPFTVGGGISALKDVEVLLQHGADKITVNTAAVLQPTLINSLADNFGSQCIVVAVDIKYQQGNWMVVTHGGKNSTNLIAMDWVIELAQRGAGEILLTSMDNDGTRKGFAIEITRQIATSINIPVIASGGAGCEKDFEEIFTQGHADAALAASLFHFNELPIPQLKNYLHSKNIAIRL